MTTKKKPEQRGLIRNVYGEWFKRPGQGTTTNKRHAHKYTRKEFTSDFGLDANERLTFVPIK